MVNLLDRERLDATRVCLLRGHHVSEQPRGDERGFRYCVDCQCSFDSRAKYELMVPRDERKRYT